MTSSALHARTVLNAWLIGQVKTGMTELGLSQQRVAKELHITEKHMSQLMTGRTPGSIDLWDRMLRQVGMREVACPLDQAAKESRYVAMEIGEREIVAPADVEASPTGAVDLMAALKASLDRAKAARTGGIIGELTKTEG